MSSKHLHFNQIRAIEKIGDVFFPGDANFPSFSASACVRHLDRILDYMPAADLKDLGLLLNILGVLPRLWVRGFVRLLEVAASWPGPIGALLRTIRLGIRGLVMSLYYGDPEALKRIGYDVLVYTDDLKESDRQK